MHLGRRISTLVKESSDCAMVTQNTYAVAKHINYTP